MTAEERHQQQAPPHAAEHGAVSRRTLLLGGGAVLGAAAVGVGGWTALGARRRWRVKEMLGLNPDPFVPDVPAGRVAVQELTSETMGKVPVFTAVPEGYGDGAGLPILVVLHGASATAHDLAGFGFGQFATAVARAGHPMVLVAPEDGPKGWEPAGSMEPVDMVTRELPAWASDRGWDGARRSLWGWSRGGYGALALAVQHPRWARSLALFSPAITPDSALLGQLAPVAPLPIGLWCGADDALNPGSRALAQALPRPPEVLSVDREGGHTRQYWNSQTLAMLSWTGGHLSAEPTAKPSAPVSP